MYDHTQNGADGASSGRSFVSALVGSSAGDATMRDVNPSDGDASSAMRSAEAASMRLDRQPSGLSLGVHPSPSLSTSVRTAVFASAPPSAPPSSFFSIIGSSFSFATSSVRTSPDSHRLLAFMSSVTGAVTMLSRSASLRFISRTMSRLLHAAPVCPAHTTPAPPIRSAHAPTTNPPQVSTTSGCAFAPTFPSARSIPSASYLM